MRMLAVALLLIGCAQDQPPAFASIAIGTVGEFASQTALYCRATWTGTVEATTMVTYTDSLWARVDSNGPGTFEFAGTDIAPIQGLITWNGPGASDSMPMVFRWHIVGTGFEAAGTSTPILCGSSYLNP